MKEFTQEMFDKLVSANNSVKGTADFGKYKMPMEYKSSNGRWVFCSWYLPHGTGIIKTLKGKTYIYVLDERYGVTEEVKILLGI